MTGGGVRAPAGIEARRGSNGKTYYRGTAYDPVRARTIKGPWGDTLAAAKSWRIDAQHAFRTRKPVADRRLTLDAAATEFLAGIGTGSITNRSGAQYKPGTAINYTRELRNRVVPRFGHLALDDLTLPRIQEWIHQLSQGGLSGSSVRNAVNPLRALYGWARPLGLATTNPTAGARLPATQQRQPMVVSKEKAEQLIDAVDPQDRIALGLAFFAGLRLGELLALSWGDIDPDRRLLKVHRSWDHKTTQFVSPKSESGIRDVLISEKLSILLDAHASIGMGTEPEQLLLPGRRKHFQPSSQSALRKRIYRSWENAGIPGPRLRIHDARHTAASHWLAAGLNFKEISTYMGHSDIRTTLNVYGHLVPGSMDAAREKIDAYLGGG